MDHTTPDRELLIATCAGEHTAFELLVARHQGLVRIACQRHGMQAELEDCMQAVFLVLLRKAAQAQRSQSLEAWLLVVARNVCATARRASAIRRKAEQGAAMHASAVSTTHMENAASEHLDDCLTRLPERQRAVIAMHFLAGTPRDEVAVRLGIDVDTVHQHCRRGLERLRDLLAQRGVALPVIGLTALLTAQGQAAAAAPPLILASTTSGTLAATYASGVTTAMTLSELGPIGVATAALLAVTVCAAIALDSAEPAGYPQPPPLQVPVVQTVPVSPPAMGSVIVTGTVKSIVDGKALAGVRVVAAVTRRCGHINIMDERLGKRRLMETMTDGAGRFALTVPVSQVPLCAVLDAFKPGFSSAATASGGSNENAVAWNNCAVIPLTIGAPIVHDLVLKPARYAAGFVTDDQGIPVPGTHVTLTHSAGGEVIADSKGHFEIFDVPTRAEIQRHAQMLEMLRQTDPSINNLNLDTKLGVSATFWDYEETKEQDISGLGDEALANLRIRIAPGKGRNPHPQSVDDGSPLIATGRVVDQFERSIPGARLFLVKDGNQTVPAREVARAGQDGRFSITAHTLGSTGGGPFQLQVRYWDFRPAILCLERQPVGTIQRDLSISLTTYNTISGHLITSAGEVMANQKFQLITNQDTPEQHHRRYYHLSADEHGDFQVELLPTCQIILEITNFQRGPKKIAKFFTEHDLLDQQILFEEGERPKVVNSVVLGGITWAEMTPELAHYYGFPLKTRRPVAVKGGARMHEGVLFESFKDDRTGKDISIADLDDLIRKLATALAKSEKPDKPLEYDVAFPDHVSSGMTLRMNETEMKSLQKLKNPQKANF